jgi:hypothetical protein
MSRRQQTWSLKTPNEANFQDEEGLGHVGVRRTKVSFDTFTSGKLLRDTHTMPPASFNRRWWHLLVLQTR